MSIWSDVQTLSAKYGAAFFVVVQGLGWITYFMIYFSLVFFDIDVASYVRYYNLGASLEALAEQGGVAALSFALNRFLTPVRLAIAVPLMPIMAPAINARLAPIVRALGFTPAPEVAATAAPAAPAASSAKTAKTVPVSWSADVPAAAAGSKKKD
ncbi:hypothetical protein BC831DRAFT_467079 [Entophlyctis helioformis]|nr:hypothetical protein BC831DRAFT_467079 [Entophlyctis helioformis]